MAGSDIGVVGQHDAAFLASDVGLVVDDGVISARLSVLADHYQTRFDFCFGGRSVGWRGVRRTGWTLGRPSTFVRSPGQASAAELAKGHLRWVRATAAWTRERARCGR